MGKYLQITLALLKPDIATNPYFVRTIENYILRNNFLIVKRKSVRWNKENAREFYRQHEERFFHQRLVEFMSSGPITALILARENAISEWRKLMGPTKVYRTRFTHPNTIRGEFGLTDTRNTVHGSDSPQSVLDEVGLFFPELDVDNWWKNEEEKFIQRKVAFDETSRVHKSSTNGDVEDNVLLQKSPDEDRLTVELGSPQTWSQYYTARPEPKEWFVGYEHLESHLIDLLNQNLSYKTVVDVGCGSSMLGPNLAKSKPYLDVYCLDISVECLGVLSEHNVASNCTFVVGDIHRDLAFDTNSVDLIIDKGTTDAVSRHEDGDQHVSNLLKDCMRILRRGGILLQITTDSPEIRLDELDNIKDDTISVSFIEMQSSSNSLPIFIYKVKKL